MIGETIIEAVIIKMKLKIDDLKETKIYYEKFLKDENLGGGERDSVLRALELIEEFIEIEKEAEKLD